MQIQLFRLLFLILIGASFLANLQAQNSADDPLSGKWQVTKMIVIDGTTAFGLIDYGGSKAAMTLMNQKGQIVWNGPVSGFIKGAGKWNGNIIVFYSEKSNIGALHAAIFDIKQKKTVRDKIIYEIPNKPIGDILVENDPGSNFNHLLFRSNENGPLITLITLSADLEIYTKVLWPANSRSFIGSHTSKQGDIFLTGIADKRLITEQFDRDGELKKKLEIELDVRNKSYFTVINRPDTFTKNNVLVAIQYENSNKDRSINLYRFDFDAGNVIGAPPVLLDRAYLDALIEKEPVAKRNLRPIDNMVPVDILVTSDKIILVKEVRTVYSSSRSVNVLNTAAVVSVFDKEMKPLHETVMSKFYLAPSTWDSHLICFLHNGKLYILSTGGSVNDFDYYCNIFDLTADKNERKKFAHERGLLDPAATVLFKNSCTLGYVDENAWGKKKTNLKAITYEDLDKLPDAHR